MSGELLASQQLHFIYHELRPGGSSYSYVMDIDLFSAHLSLFAKLRTTPGCPHYPNVTFDDGHLSDYEHALPLLQLHNLKANFFITTGWTGKKIGYMGWAEIKSLVVHGHVVGAHGWSHTLLTQCNSARLNSELLDSKAVLEDALGKPVTTMSLPGGRFNSRVISACEDAGYTQIYTSVPQSTPAPLPLLIGRLNVLGGAQTEWLARLFDPNDSLLSGLKSRYRLKLAAKKALGDSLYEKLCGQISRRTSSSVTGGVSQ
jgi:peptidoglycan/xylan/chitin deacetylase (PgdA/CDA1 family)